LTKVIVAITPSAPDRIALSRELGTTCDLSEIQAVVLQQTGSFNFLLASEVDVSDFGNYAF